jgi:hypothetical protein
MSDFNTQLLGKMKLPPALQEKAELFIKTFMENMQLMVESGQFAESGKFGGTPLTPEQSLQFSEQSKVMSETAEAIMAMGYYMELVPVEALPPELAADMAHMKDDTMKFIIHLLPLPENPIPKHKLH